jgi:hypothetical protein
MVPSIDDLPHPVLERITWVERKRWRAALERQYQTRGSSYRRSLRWYGETGATDLTVANLWLLQSVPFIVLIFVSSFVENGPLLLLALVGAFLYQTRRVGKRWRQDSGVGPPPRWRSRTGYQPPEGDETTPPIGWAQTSKIPPGWTHPDDLAP